MLRRGASLRRRSQKRKANVAFKDTAKEQRERALFEYEIQPSVVPNQNPANELEPRWLGKQGPLIYRTSNFISETGENPKQVVGNFRKSGVKKMRVNSVQFMVSFYKLKTDQVLTYVLVNTAKGTQNLSITIPKGNYSKRELQTQFKRELHLGRIQMKTNAANQTVLYVIPETGDDQFTSFVVTFTACQDLKEALGFRTDADIFAGSVSQTISKSNGVATTGATATSSEHINLALPNSIHVCSPRLHNLMRSQSIDMSTDQEQNQFIATIPIYVNSGQFVSWQNPNNDFYDCYGSGDFGFDDIGFCYSDGSIVDFNGGPWTIEIGYMTDDAGSMAGDLITT